MKPAPTRHREDPIFYDATGRRWQLISIIVFLLAVFFFTITQWGWKSNPNKQQYLEEVTANDSLQRQGLIDLLSTIDFRNLFAKSFFGYSLAFLIFTLSWHLLSLLLFLISKLHKELPLGVGQAPISIVIPCFNEAKVIVKTVTAALKSHYASFEVIIVNDGSTDNSRAILERHFKHKANVTLINISNGGKANAVNHALLKCKHDLVVCVDADTVLHPDCLKQLSKHIANPAVTGVAGNVQIGNRKNLLTAYQSLEYISGQSFQKQSLQVINQVFVVPGAIGLWRKDTLLNIQGLNHDTVAEDTDLTVRVITNGGKIVYERRALAFTEAPESWQEFIKQRFRWQIGTLQVTAKNLKFLFNKKGGVTGFILLPVIILENIFIGIFPLNFAWMIILALDWLRSLGVFQIAWVPDQNPAIYSVVLGYWLLTLILALITRALAIGNEPLERPWRLVSLMPLYIFYYQGLLWVIQLYCLLIAAKGLRIGWTTIKREGSVPLQHSPTAPK